MQTFDFDRLVHNFLHSHLLGHLHPNFAGSMDPVPQTNGLFNNEKFHLNDTPPPQTPNQNWVTHHPKVLTLKLAVQPRISSPRTCMELQGSADSAYTRSIWGAVYTLGYGNYGIVFGEGEDKSGDLILSGLIYSMKMII